ncbi:aspartate-semialdehyde dehydrogenase [candidate division KSB1 bacterium]|nr:aspartate-semialdehyde dehydrogenase [candidate division KSB1 bacterium]RQW00875.1 MAG: aspartate-semialdehyde dehydrogenase [candidate division KSB1 bacterium]
MEKVRCAVLGATGVVGQNFLRLLVDHPYFELAAICASDMRIGQSLKSAKEQIDGGIPKAFADIIFDPIDVGVLVDKKIKIAFSALPADVAKNVEKEAAKQGIKIFSNAGAYRMDKDVPILIPEINHAHLDIVKQQDTPGYIVTNANCTTTGLTMALLPILPFGIRKMVVASYQAISGAGYPGLPALDIFGNVIPYIQNEEPKLRRETTKICGTFQNGAIVPADWEVYAHCIRVQTVIGHLISVHIELDSQPTREEVKQAIVNYTSPPEVAGLPTAPEQTILFSEEPDRPQPRYDVLLGAPERARGMAIFIGRLEVERNIIRFVTLSNNLVRGAAGGSVLNAELAYRKGLL